MKAITRPFKTYYTIKFKVNESTNPANELMSTANAWFTALQSVDPLAIVYGFKDLEPTHGILRPTDIPKGIVSSKEYYMGANPRPDEGFVWASVWLGHALDADDLYSNFKFWLKKNETFMYKKKLQEKNTVRDYFLLWSTQSMCERTMYEATQAALKKVTKEEHSFAFVWSIVKREDGRYVNNESTQTLGRQYVRALHIEAPKDKAELTYRARSKFFCSTSRKPILFRRLRMVPVLRQSNTSRTKAKIN